MELNKLKDELTHVAFNYSFFEFQLREKQNRKFPFEIKQIRSFDSNTACSFYKPLTRSVSLNNFRKDE